MKKTVRPTSVSPEQAQALSVIAEWGDFGATPLEVASELGENYSKTVRQLERMRFIQWYRKGREGEGCFKITNLGRRFLGRFC